MTLPRDDIHDFELIRRMADQKTNFAGARDAWGRFYVRHHRFLLRVCASDHAYLLGMEEVKDLVHNAFLKAFSGATTFDHSEVCKPMIQERKSRGWMISIVENLVRDRFRGQPEVCIVDASEIDQLGGATDYDPDEPHVPESERMKLLKSGFALLSDIEQTVLRATMFWWQPNQQYQRMPHAALLQLSQQIGKSPENIRQIRVRAVEKLRKHVTNNLRNEKAD